MANKIDIRAASNVIFNGLKSRRIWYNKHIVWEKPPDPKYSNFSVDELVLTKAQPSNTVDILSNDIWRITSPVSLDKITLSKSSGELDSQITITSLKQNTGRQPTLYPLYLESVSLDKTVMQDVLQVKDAVNADGFLDIDEHLTPLTISKDTTSIKVSGRTNMKFVGFEVFTTDFKGVRTERTAKLTLDNKVVLAEGLGNEQVNLGAPNDPGRFRGYNVELIANIPPNTNYPEDDVSPDTHIRIVILGMTDELQPLLWAMDIMQKGNEPYLIFEKTGTNELSHEYSYTQDITFKIPFETDMASKVIIDNSSGDLQLLSSGRYLTYFKAVEGDYGEGISTYAYIEVKDSTNEVFVETGNHTYGVELYLDFTIMLEESTKTKANIHFRFIPLGIGEANVSTSLQAWANHTPNK